MNGAAEIQSCRPTVAPLERYPPRLYDYCTRFESVASAGAMLTQGQTFSRSPEPDACSDFLKARNASAK